METLTRTGPDRPRRALILGGSGGVGRHLLQLACDRGRGRRGRASDAHDYGEADPLSSGEPPVESAPVQSTAS